MPARTPKGRIQKGKNLENYVSEQIKEKDLDTRAKRSFGSGNTNTEKSDIHTSLTILGQNAGIECKHADKINIHQWWRQTVKLQGLGYEPVLVYKQTADKYEDTKAVIYLDTLLELLREIKHLEKRLGVFEKK